MNFRSKVLEKEAIQWTGDNYEAIRDFVVASAEYEIGRDKNDLLIHWVAPGPMVAWRVPVGQWVVKGVKGEFYAVTDEVFRLSYDVATPAPTIEDVKAQLDVFIEELAKEENPLKTKVIRLISFLGEKFLGE